MVDYATHLQSIQAAVENDNAEFIAEMPQIISRAEATIYRSLPKLPCFRQTDTGTMGVGSNTITLPTNFRVPRSMTFTASSSEVPLQQRTTHYLEDYWPAAATTGVPKFYAQDTETTFLIAPTPAVAYPYTLKWIGPAPGLTASNTTTWISTNLEDILFHGTLKEAWIYLQDPENAAGAKADYDLAVTTAVQENRAIMQSEFGSGV